MAQFQTLAAFLRAMPSAWIKQLHFHLDLTWQKCAPDGNMREIIFMNDQFPGPELRLNQDDGDNVEDFEHNLTAVIYADHFQVVVHNSLPFNITVHFHGIEQRNTAWSDGVHGLTQKRIQPEHNWTYK
jgi:FtsP/CotA-like multicopper oxidase with cupredoxin domain